MDLSRLEILIGQKNTDILCGSSVAVIGLGGVGGICAESLTRSGIGTLYICDGDKVEPSNINRQIAALQSTIGVNKAIALKTRLEDINPAAEIKAIDKNWTAEDNFLLGEHVDYVVDAIDNVPNKVDLICMCKEKGIKIISSMGAGLRHHGNMFEAADIFRTFNDPLAKKMRRLLKERGIDSLDVVYSKEKPMKAEDTIGSAMFSVGACGLLLSEYVVHALIENKREEQI
ncbi:MAG: ThiF family adenylyltransferase [Clostridia bacterium]|nr:ThiF family adenylyltransferase [Clostridia bacterium]